MLAKCARPLLPRGLDDHTGIDAAGPNMDADVRDNHRDGGAAVLDDVQVASVEHDAKLIRAPGSRRAAITQVEAEQPAVAVGIEWRPFGISLHGAMIRPPSDAAFVLD